MPSLRARPVGALLIAALGALSASPLGAQWPPETVHLTVRAGAHSAPDRLYATWRHDGFLNVGRLTSSGVVELSVDVPMASRITLRATGARSFGTEVQAAGGYVCFGVCLARLVRTPPEQVTVGASLAMLTVGLSAEPLGDLGRFTPYAFAGLGGKRHRVDAITDENLPAELTVPSGTLRSGTYHFGGGLRVAVGRADLVAEAGRYLSFHSVVGGWGRQSTEPQDDLSISAGVRWTLSLAD